MKKRTIVVLMIVGGITSVPLALLVLVLFLLTFAYLPFLSQFEIVNQTGQQISVTPIGVWAGSGEYGPLPTFFSALPSIPYWRKGVRYDIPLAQSASVRVLYDMDDIQFGDILVRAESGEVLILVTGEIDGGCCTGALKDRYEIPPLAELPKAPPELLPCIDGETVSYSVVLE